VVQLDVVAALRRHWVRGWRIRLRAGGGLRFPHRCQSIHAEIEKQLCASRRIAQGERREKNPTATPTEKFCLTTPMPL